MDIKGFTVYTQRSRKRTFPDLEKAIAHSEEMMVYESRGSIGSFPEVPILISRGSPTGGGSIIGRMTVNGFKREPGSEWFWFPFCPDCGKEIREGEMPLYDEFCECEK